MRTLAALIIAFGAATPAFGATNTPMPMNSMSMPMAGMMMMHHGNISVDATGEVQFVPDIAHITLGVNGEAASAAAAMSDVASRANAVIAALKSLGIASGDIKTSGFNLYYREPSQSVKGAFAASESISIKAAVDKAGAAIDAAIRAGANQSYGLQYDTSLRDSLYTQAVQRAVQRAHDLAQAAASAAGVKLGPVVSITVPSYAAPGVVPLVRTMAMAAPAPPPIEPGTGTIAASVTVTYSIAR